MPWRSPVPAPHSLAAFGKCCCAPCTLSLSGSFRPERSAERVTPESAVALPAPLHSLAAFGRASVLRRKVLLHVRRFSLSDSFRTPSHPAQKVLWCSTVSVLAPFPRTGWQLPAMPECYPRKCPALSLRRPFLTLAYVGSALVLPCMCVLKGGPCRPGSISHWSYLGTPQRSCRCTVEAWMEALHIGATF